MAKKKPAETSLSAVTNSAQLPIITVPAGGTLVVGVDVGPMTIPYTVAYAGQTLLKSLVDRIGPVPVQQGDRVMAWAFSHTEKGWTHAVGVSINDGPVQILEQKSEANKDSDHSVGVVVVRA